MWRGVSGSLAVAMLAIASSAHAQATQNCCDVPADQFPKVGGNLGNTSHSSLNQITRANAAQLGGAWHVRLENGDESAFQQGNVIEADTMVFAETTQGSVVALDGATGVERWRFKGSYGASLRRGVAVGDGRVYTIKGNAGHVIALDERTGKVIWDKVPTTDRTNGSFPTAIVYHDGHIYFGTANGARGVAFALDARTGETVWKFYGPAGPGEIGNDTWAGDSWKTGGAAPWAYPAIDPKLGLLYWTFGNARAGAPLDGAVRAGQNLFANSLVAVDLKTGKHVWHFQSVHHDIWDMDNVMAPVLIDMKVGGRERQAVVYGSKTAMLYILDRKTGAPILPIDEKAVPQEPAQHTWPTQPFPRGEPLVSLCPTGRTPPHYKTGCIFEPHLDFPVIVSPGTGGGADTSAYSYDPQTGLLYVGLGNIGIAQARKGSFIGFRPLGEDRSGKIVAFNPLTQRIAWSRPNEWSLAHGNGILSTAGGVLFMGYPDGYFVALDKTDGRELWRFQTGAGVHTSPITYRIAGQQYVAVFAGGNSLPYNSPRGDHLWAFKIGGTVPPAPVPVPPPHRQPITAAAVEGSTINNLVRLGVVAGGASERAPAGQVTGLPGSPAPGGGPSDAGRIGTRPSPQAPAEINSIRVTESDTQNAMLPQHLRVPVGTTVTFENPASNSKEHCATQFFEKLFDTGPLKPGSEFKYTFKQKGEFFYNDCVSPGTTGKIVVY